MLMKMKSRLRAWLRDGSLPAPRNYVGGWLHSAERMQAIVNRERLRADRAGGCFSVLTLKLQMHYRQREVADLAGVLQARIRVTDDAGYMGPYRIAIVLPDTPAGGAWKLADDICRLLPEEMHRPECEVYTYPTQIEPHEPTPNRAARNGTPANGVRTNHLLKNGADKSCAAHSAKVRAHSMHALFVQPLPTWKRALDVMGAFTALVLLSPLMLLVAAAIKLTSRGPIIFTQKRDTIGGRQFTIYKFRTMAVDAESKKSGLMALNEQDGPAFKIARDPRVTWLGRILRATSIDELPQFFNVLMGDMALVGPRAMDSKESSRCEQWQRRRLDVTAGITCIWQVRGRSSVSFAEWMRMDLSYIRSRSLMNDLKLMAQTIPAVLLRRGAH